MERLILSGGCQLQDLSVQVSRETHAHGVSFNSLTLPSWHVLLTDGQRKVHMVLTGLARGGERPTEGSSHGAVAAKEREAETSEVRPAIRPLMQMPSSAKKKPSSLHILLVSFNTLLVSFKASIACREARVLLKSSHTEGEVAVASSPVEAAQGGGFFV